MTKINRRKALGTLFLTGGALGFSGWALPAHARLVSIVPSGPMLLTRRIERSLHGGAELTVERRWTVAFSRQGRGIAIAGDQVEAIVEAPESLAPLAEIERSRLTDDMWPIMLSGEGRIVAAGADVRQEDFAAAVDEAGRMIVEMDLPASEQQSVMQHLAQLQRAGGSLLETLPADLFYPRMGPMRQVREVALPGGLTGEFEVRYDAIAVSDGGWLDRARREVITRIGVSERRAREFWTLSEVGL